MKKARIIMKISPTMATGTAHTAAFRPLFFPVCLPAAVGGTRVPSEAREIKQTKPVKIFKKKKTSWILIQALEID